MGDRDKRRHGIGDLSDSAVEAAEVCHHCTVAVAVMYCEGVEKPAGLFGVWMVRVAVPVPTGTKLKVGELVPGVKTTGVGEMVPMLYDWNTISTLQGQP